MKVIILVKRLIFSLQNLFTWASSTLLFMNIVLNKTLEYLSEVINLKTSVFLNASYYINTELSIHI